jgi:hypothetical protein
MGTWQPTGIHENAIKSSIIADDPRPPDAAAPVSTGDETTWGSSGDDHHVEIREDPLAKKKEKAQAMQAKRSSRATLIAEDSGDGTSSSA